MIQRGVSELDAYSLVVEAIDSQMFLGLELKDDKTITEEIDPLSDRKSTDIETSQEASMRELEAITEQHKIIEKPDVDEEIDTTKKESNSERKKEGDLKKVERRKKSRKGDGRMKKGKKGRKKKSSSDK
jgi:hypothetical protein